MKSTFFFLFLLALLSSCDQQLHKEALDDLTNGMSGTFTNELQAQADTNFSSRILNQCAIWENAKASRWLYSEEAMAEFPDRPFRQRVYELKAETDSTFTMDIYLFPKSHLYVGHCDSSKVFPEAMLDSLLLRERCTIGITKIGDGIYQSNIIDRKGCTSRRKDIAYLTTDLFIDPQHFELWIRGYDFDDQQVFGSIQQPYHFERAN